MPRRRHQPGRFLAAGLTPDPETFAQMETMRRRYAYLVTNRHRLHEAAVLVDAAVKHEVTRLPDLLPGVVPHATPDIRALARDVVAWKAARGLPPDHPDGYWHTRDAIHAVRPGAYADPARLDWRA